MTEEERTKILALMEETEPYIEQAIGLRKRFIAEGFDETLAAGMAGLTYMAALAPGMIGQRK